MYVLLVPEWTKFNPFCSTGNRFGVTGHFETSAQSDIEHCEVKVIYCMFHPQVTNSSPFHSTASRFHVTGHVEKSLPNDLEHYEVNVVSHIYPANTGDSKFQCLLLYDQPFSSYTDYFETYALNDPENTLNTTKLKVV